MFTVTRDSAIGYTAYDTGLIEAIVHSFWLQYSCLAAVSPALTTWQCRTALQLDTIKSTTISQWHFNRVAW